MEYRQELGLGTKLKTYLGTEAGAKNGRLDGQ